MKCTRVCMIHTSSCIRCDCSTPRDTIIIIVKRVHIVSIGYNPPMSLIYNHDARGGGGGHITPYKLMLESLVFSASLAIYLH